MAIHKDVKGYEVTVCVDGEPLKEYEHTLEQGSPSADRVAQHKAEKTMTRYVEAVDGKAFTIKIGIKRRTTIRCEALVFRVFVDGKKIRGKYSSRHSAKIGEGFTIKGPKSRVDGVNTIRSMKFSKIETTESNSINLADEDQDSKKITEDKDNIAGVGTIEIVVHRTTKLVLSTLGTDFPFHAKAQGKIHEKALKGKAISHGTKFGEAEIVAERVIMTCEYVDGKDYPIAIYKFHYRSNAALKALKIIEEPVEEDPPASPPPAALAGLSEKDRKEIKEYMGRQMKGHIKQEVTEDERPRKRQKKSLGKVTIDLTEEDDEDGHADSLLVE
ncbi:hypothetical protein PVAG01_04387 [Phlyctema vagabunda]|uniref:DUF7918 domain-containing protein n=1 Tax=Phlyctema vagabunda TaxID=108571 RepID=A0ABR4PQD0_9HELO